MGSRSGARTHAYSGTKPKISRHRFRLRGHVLQAPKPDTLTPENIAADFLRIADAAEAERFAYYGYSWLALSGLQLAIRTGQAHGIGDGRISTDRWPVRRNAESHERDASNVIVQCFRQPTERNGASGRMGRNHRGIRLVQRRSVHERKTDEAVCHALRTFAGFDDRKVQSRLTCPRLCFAGSKDRIEYGEKWGNVTVDIVSPLVHRKGELTQAGWDVRILDGLDHTGSMQARHVLPVLLPWLDSHLSGHNISRMLVMNDKDPLSGNLPGVFFRLSNG